MILSVQVVKLSQDVTHLLMQEAEHQWLMSASMPTQVLLGSFLMDSMISFVVVVDVIMMCCSVALDSSLAVHGFQFYKMVEGAKGSK